MRSNLDEVISEEDEICETFISKSELYNLL